MLVSSGLPPSTGGPVRSSSELLLAHQACGPVAGRPGRGKRTAIPPQVGR